MTFKHTVHRPLLLKDKEVEMWVTLNVSPDYRRFGLFQEDWTEVKCENHGLWACDQCFHAVNPWNLLGPLILFSFLCIVKCLINFFKNHHVFTLHILSSLYWIVKKMPTSCLAISFPGSLVSPPLCQQVTPLAKLNCFARIAVPDGEQRYI